MIAECGDEKERVGRLKLLNHLMYDLMNYDLYYVLRCYAAWLREVELGIHKWGDEDWVRTVDTVLKRAPMSTTGFDTSNVAPSSEKRKAVRSSVGMVGEPKMWFCTMFNRNKCGIAAPHMAEIRGFGKEEVHHMCRTCYMEDRKVMAHAECAEVCPHNGTSTGGK